MRYTKPRKNKITHKINQIFRHVDLHIERNCLHGQKQSQEIQVNNNTVLTPRMGKQKRNEKITRTSNMDYLCLSIGKNISASVRQWLNNPELSKLQDQYNHNKTNRHPLNNLPILSL